MNLGLIIATVVIVGGGVFFLWWRSRKSGGGGSYEDEMSPDKLFSIVKNTLADLVKEESITGLTELEFENSFKRKARINDAMKKCVFGIESAKVIVIDLIRKVIVEYLTDEKEVLQVVNFKSMFLDVRYKFEVLLYYYKKEHGMKALEALILKYEWNKPRYIIENKTRASYAVTDQDVNNAFSQENFQMTYDEMIDVLSVILYQRYKGFGAVDTINEMDINGFNFGTSGSVLSAISTRETNKLNKATNSLWLYFRGTYIHFRFINFGSEEEVRRIVQLIARYNSPGPLTEKRGFIVNTMFNKSRVLAVRPPLGEYWAVFVRKFTLSDPSLRGLIEKEYTKNADLPINMIKWMMMGQVTAAYTGRQGSGKTTMMTGVFEFADPMHNVRVIEMAPEMYLRELYPERNILSLQETLTVTATMAQDALKKSDAAVTVVGEVATDEIAANMIQAAQIASLYTIFSHHANRAEDLVYGIRNSLVNAKGYDMKTAEAQVLQVIHMNVHLNYGTDGKRYIERFTEIIPLSERTTYPELDPMNLELSKAAIEREYYIRSTDRKTFESRDLIRWNRSTLTYEAHNCPSEHLINHMLGIIPIEFQEDFMDFVEKTWLKRS